MRVTKEQNIKRKKISNNKGITMVALVITIIVMLILVAVSIVVAVNGELFTYTKSAVEETNQAIKQEQNEVGQVDEYVSENWEWLGFSTPEDVFIWGSDNPNDEDYRTIVGYTANIDNYPTLRIPARCTKIDIDDSYFHATSDLGKQMRGYTKNIKEIELPSTLVEIGDRAFGEYNFESVKKITIPKTVTTIGNSAFSCCKSLAKITIPDSVTNIAPYAFNGVVRICYAGTAEGAPWGAAVVTEDEEWVKWDGAEEWDKNAASEDAFIWRSDDPKNDGYGVIIGYTAKINNYPSLRFPSRCTIIMIDNAYIQNIEMRSHTKSIKEVEFPNTLIAIANNAFYNNTINFYNFEALEKVTIPDSVVNIGNDAFNSCSNLKNITMGSGLQRVGDSAFAQCYSLIDVTIPDSVTSIGTSAFNGVNHINYNGTATGATWGALSMN